MIDSATLQAMSPFQRMIVERALVLAREIECTALDAPRGQALDQCEQLLIRDGRQLLRDCLEGALQSAVDRAEKKGAQPEPVRAATPDATRAATPRRS
jgi:hypothetical protein